MNKNILIGIFVVILIIGILYFSMENFPYGSYVQDSLSGRLLPRARDRDTNAKYHLDQNKNKDNKLNRDEYEKLNHIITDSDTGNYTWDPLHHFPYGGYIYDKSYPVYLAKNICPDDKPYYNTIDGTCIQVNFNTPATINLNTPTI
jgi:hypothetical protein